MKKAFLVLACMLALGACADAATVATTVDGDGDGHMSDVDCDDARAESHPGATEVCNGLDDDCDGSADEALFVTFYADADHDGYGDGTASVIACSGMPAGAVDNDDDCNDADMLVHPGATESCSSTVDSNCDGSVGDADGDGDGFVACLDCNDAVFAINPDATEVCDAGSVDEDCDGLSNDADESVTQRATFHADTDGDGYGDPETTVTACVAPVDTVVDATDCDDALEGVHPNAQEVCDAQGVDEDCDDLADDADTSATGKMAYYADEDEDGFGDPEGAIMRCTAPEGVVVNDDDCDDALEGVHPNAQEVCDAEGIDEDCDDVANDADLSVMGQTTFYADVDEDGFGDADVSMAACSAPEGMVEDSDDCDDTLDDVNPDALEICDAIDHDCDGVANFGYDVPTHHATITEAVNAAPTGSRICVLPGTHAPFAVTSKDLTIEGADRTTTIIDSTGTANAIRFTNATGTVRGFTVRNATSYVYLVTGANTGTRTLEDVEAYGNRHTNASDCSGIVHLDGASATLRDVYLHDNTITCTRDSSGVISLTNSQATMTLERVRIIANTFSVGRQHRSMIFAYNGNIVATNVIIAGNSVTGMTADRALWSFGISGDVYGTSSVTATNVDIVGNYADANMAAARALGVYAPYGSTVTLTNVSVFDNDAAIGSAVRVYDLTATASVTYGNVFGNVATTSATWGFLAAQTGSNGNVTVAPGYVSTEGADAKLWDLSLAVGSAMIDAGSPSVLDIEGTRSDIGAYGGPSAEW